MTEEDRSEYDTGVVFNVGKEEGKMLALSTAVNVFSAEKLGAFSRQNAKSDIDDTGRSPSFGQAVDDKSSRMSADRRSIDRNGGQRRLQVRGKI